MFIMKNMSVGNWSNDTWTGIACGNQNVWFLSKNVEIAFECLKMLGCFACNRFLLLRERQMYIKWSHLCSSWYACMLHRDVRCFRFFCCKNPYWFLYNIFFFSIYSRSLLCIIFSNSFEIYLVCNAMIEISTTTSL